MTPPATVWFAILATTLAAAPGLDAQHTPPRTALITVADEVIIPGARHYLFLTHPGEVAHEILSFMLGR